MILILLVFIFMKDACGDFADKVNVQPLGGFQSAGGLRLSVTTNGVETTLVQRDDEDIPTASRRWVKENGLSNELEVDSVLRLLVQRLRREGGAEDGLPVTTEGGRRTLASVQVRGRLEGDELGPLHLARWLDGESVGEAALGFVERLGLPLDPNVGVLEREFTRLAEAAVPSPSPSLPTLTQDGSMEPSIPPGQGFSLRVTFKDRGEEPPAYIVYRFGEDVTRVVSAFLDEHSVFEETARAEAVATLTKSLVTRAADALEGVGGGTREESGEGGVQDVISPHAFTLPVAVGDLGYDISIPEGASLWATSHLFCEQHWEELEPKMRAAVEALFTSQLQTATSGRKGEKVVTHETCRAIVFDLLVKMVRAS